MDPQLWKNVLDDLDEDIVNSAAERFGNVNYTDESPESYPADNKPTIYSYPEKKKPRRRLWAGVGACAAGAACVAAVVGVTLKCRPVQNIVQPLSDGASMKTSSTPSTTPFEVRDAAELESSFTSPLLLEEFPQGFSAPELTLFTEYFYGEWAGDNFTVILSWSADSAFGDGYTCSGIEQTDEGCYMGAQDGSKYDLWFVPENDRGTLHIYRGVSVIDGTVQRDGSGIICESTDILSISGSPEEGSTLGYFGRIKLADSMGMTADTLFNKTQLETYEGSESGADTWTRAESYEPIWNKVVLRSQTENDVKLSMAFTNSENITQYFDIDWTTADDGSWYIHSLERSMDVFARTADDLKVTLTLSDLDIFENYFYGDWTSESGDITLSYAQDIFGAGTYCGGFYAGTDGWSMYSYTGKKVQVYYISYSDPFTMFLYEPDKFGYAAQTDYIAEYTHTDYGYSELDTSNLSWLGLQRWILDTGSTTDETSLAHTVYSAMKQSSNDLWSDEFGTAGLFEGYKINALSDSKYQFMFQQFSTDGEIQWVTMVLSFIDNAWEVLPADGISVEVSG